MPSLRKGGKRARPSNTEQQRAKNLGICSLFMPDNLMAVKKTVAPRIQGGERWKEGVRYQERRKVHKRGRSGVSTHSRPADDDHVRRIPPNLLREVGPQHKDVAVGNVENVLGLRR